MLNNGKAGICWEFERTGTCKYGKRCHYEHPTTSAQRRVEPPPEILGFFNNNGLGTPSPSVDGKLREWKRLLGRQAPVSRPPPATVARFFQLALELMDGDVSSYQEVIKNLATEQGLCFVKDVVERHLDVAVRTGPSITFWNTELKPLFQLITNHRVIDSSILESEVAMIFNFILGVGGSRMSRLFGYLAQLATEWPDKTAAKLKLPAVELSLAVLSKLMDCNTTNIVNQNFTTLIDQFAQIVAAEGDEQETFASLQSLKYIDYIRRRLQTGDDIPTLSALTKGAIAREEFVLRRDLPGTLSAEGPRHDNDFADMSKISIFPTCEEIMSPRAEYLPTNDSSQWHIGGIRGRLDREFRLLREDTIGQLRDTVRDVLDNIKKPQEMSAITKNNLRTYMYEDPVPIRIDISRNAGLEVQVRCQQLPATAKLGKKDREEWWHHSRRLRAGALVCIIDVSGSVQFFVVSQSTLRSRTDPNFRSRKDKVVSTGEQGQQAANTLSDDPNSLFVTLQLVNHDEEDVENVLRWYRAVGPDLQRYLVEFPGVLLDSFRHTLAALQQMYKKQDMPFSNILAPTSQGEQVVLKPPLYARKPMFTFDLSCLEQGFEVYPEDLPSSNELAWISTLDATQSSAVLNTLAREVSLIQGPPGTGKSYTGEKIIQILLANKEEAELGPILCVCYTNHALDQLLEHLLDAGVEGIIRIGSRSKSERMTDLTLQRIVKRFEKTKAEKGKIGKAESFLHRTVQQFGEALQELAHSQSWSAIKTLLLEEYPHQYHSIFPEAEEDGWTTVMHQKPEDMLNQWLQGGHHIAGPLRPLSALVQSNLLEMSNLERCNLFEYWLKSIRDPIISSITELNVEYSEYLEERRKVQGDLDLRCLQQADIIGVTTTGLAKNTKLLRRLRSKVMVCEEAGEVLEAHILTALLPSLEHAILIGDHLQLRPQINSFDLQSSNPSGVQYSLDMSLFERLVIPPHPIDPRLPYSSLETQRRMHPSVSALVRSTLYPDLKDSETVQHYPEIYGMKKRLFWLHHDKLETGANVHDPLSTSHSNDFEVEMTTALVSHLVRQGEYEKGQIAVLTPYLGQLHKLRRRMASILEIFLNERDQDELAAMDDNTTLPIQSNAPNNSKRTLLKTIRIATVDNFQGEEAEVVIISLVRSNTQNRCGFLSTANRVNVLLSRAKHGMYIIGNSNTYKHVPMWHNVIEMLDKRGNIGTSLQLQFLVDRNVAEATQHVDTVAISPATRVANAHLVISPVRLCAAIRNAADFAMNHACLVQKSSVSPAAHTPSVLCHVLYPAIGFLAQGAVRSCSSADINVSFTAVAAVMRISHVAICHTDALFGSGPSICGEECPDSRFCQSCASEDIKSVCVDFLELKEYREVDLDQQPCVFPDCGHFLTITSMDRQLDMASHYDMDLYDKPANINKQSEPFSMDGTVATVCATCRGSLRNIARYGRIVRRAILDEATKKFISWSNMEYRSLSAKFLKAQEALGQAANLGQATTVAKSQRSKHSASRFQYLDYVEKADISRRYGDLITTWREIFRFTCAVRVEAQPFQRVADHVRHANRRQGTTKKFKFDEAVIQMKGFLLARTLLLKCELGILCDFFVKCQGRAICSPDFCLNLEQQFKECEEVIQLGQKSVHPKEEVQALIFKAQLYAIAGSVSAGSVPPALGNESFLNKDAVKERGMTFLRQAKELLQLYPSTVIFEDEINAAELSLDGLYQELTSSEIRTVIEAMVGVVGGAGNWYTCRNGHPFNIGGCGRPMEVARCPECNESVGGWDHEMVDGVEDAPGLDRLVREVGKMGV
ncbi:NFX1-type zinc finger-containing protein 1 [Pochonia chlamydosporia 170]|uniref:NFX1-type zinc finger-containing protein 1 n=1 Tax=Pochonia chlamydosporia 170 TaxID=1380566 RepID=A0A179FH02_METCM|nr:NFX1-type zinc finger-containing protein 1 [Pochonia chlamydosporia 170]OAQ64570.2 NFX1-type zinc finger-containing protein 1 [Pochonia chlamydosporia 170]